MRKIYLSMIALACGTISMAQNLDFEAGWTPFFQGQTVATYMTPDDWFGFMQQEQPGANSTANAMRLETENDAALSTFLAAQAQITVTGNNVAGFGLYEQGIGGAAFPVSVDFYYQFSPVGNDTLGTVLVEVYDTMAAGNTDDVLLAQGIGFYTTSQTTWMTTSIPLTVIATGTHNLLTISAYSSPKDFVSGFPFAVPDPQDGTYLLMDEITLVGNMASVEENDDYAVNAYPNPASDNFRIELPDMSARTISVINMTGQVMKTIPVNNLNVTVNVADLESGVYFYQLKGDDGATIATKKIIVKK
ncbi:MAG: T9SS type A sorting domain-containing protein [Crocinitomicaceae bacterium]|nr:T9SS type A sorting domain-containing protein [Crocinitomicaceae bacterium]